MTPFPASPQPSFRLHLLAAALLLTAAPVLARTPPKTPSASPLQLPASGVIGVQDAQLTPGFWLARTQQPTQVLLSPQQIESRNTRLLREDTSMHDLAAQPASLTGAQVRTWIEALASPPTKPLWDEAGNPIPQATLDAIVSNRALPAIPASQTTRYGMAVQRAALRTFPTRLRVFSSQGDADIDRFQESALFPGDAVVITQSSADGQWLFVVSQRYAAWVEASAIAEGGRDAVLGYAARAPFRIITGAKPRTVFTREQPRLSELQLDMGTRIPLAEAAANKPVNGQHPYTSWILDLPIRSNDGRLSFAPALLQKNTESSAVALPLTRANVIGQAFKFLGERYGWGHSYNGRDCSGFVSDVYRSMGVQMPRNTSAQAVSPVLSRSHFDTHTSRQQRMAAVAALDVGDLIYIPGHVMMFLGRINGAPYVIHDTNGGSFLDRDGTLRSMHLNGVSVTPLLPLRFDKDTDYVDRITNIVRMSKLQ